MNPIHPTRRAFLSVPLAAALPTVASTRPAVPPELAAAAAELSGILDRMGVLWDDRERLRSLFYPVEVEPGAREAFRRFNREVWDPACDAMDAAEDRLRDAMDRAGVPGLAVAGRLYIGMHGSVGMDRDHYPSSLTVVDLAGVVGLDAAGGATQ